MYTLPGGADANLDAALAEVARVLELTGVEVIVNKINVNSEQLAIAHNVCELTYHSCERARYTARS